MTTPIVEKYGSLSAVGIAKETTFGTPVTPTSFVPFTDVTLESDPGLFFPQVVMGIRDVNVFALYGEYKHAGDVSAPFFPTNGLELFVAAIGSDTVTSAGGGKYLHTIAAANSLNSMTVEKNIGGYQSLQFAGSKVGKYNVKASAGDNAVEFTASLVSKSATVLDTPSSPISVVNESPFVFAEAELSVFGNTNLIQVTSVSIDIENGLKPTYTFNGSHDLQFLTPLTRKVTGQIQVVFDSLDDTDWGYYTKLMNGTQGSLNVSFTHPSGQAMTITLPQINLSKYADDIKMDNVVMSTLDFEASYDLATATASIGATVTNLVSTAY